MAAAALETTEMVKSFAEAKKLRFSGRMLKIIDRLAEDQRPIEDPRMRAVEKKLAKIPHLLDRQRFLLILYEHGIKVTEALLENVGQRLGEEHGLGTAETKRWLQIPGIDAWPDFNDEFEIDALSYLAYSNVFSATAPLSALEELAKLFVRCNMMLEASYLLFQAAAEKMDRLGQGQLLIDEKVTDPETLLSIRAKVKAFIVGTLADSQAYFVKDRPPELKV